MPEQVVYEFKFDAKATEALWLCIQNAPLPRSTTDSLAVAFMKQLDEQNQTLAAHAKTNGSQPATDPPLS